MSLDAAPWEWLWWVPLIGLLVGSALFAFRRLRLKLRQREMSKPMNMGAATAAAAGRIEALPGPAQDALTGLSNRLYLEDRLSAAAMRAESQRRRLALLYIDVDGFKSINESYGYDVGDILLREVARRLTGLGRSSDTLARMGADEFIMLMDGDPDHASAALVSSRIRAALQAPYQLNGHEVLLSCSIGIVLYPDHGPRARLIARADAAMMAAKRAGGNIHCFYDEDMDSDALDTIELQRDLRHALDTNTGLELHYQPKVNSRSGAITGAEALLRWHHPERGMVSPAVFVPVAERFGLINALGQWVIDSACRQVRVWQEQGMVMPIAINLSVHQLRQKDLVARVMSSIQRHAVPTQQLMFEVTESAAMEDAQASLRMFTQLTDCGMGISIDDFGTGYSSLSHLRKLPASQLKIDRSFVGDLERESDARAIVRAVIRLAHALGLSVVAEGVETVEQQNILLRMGCDEFQGYLFAKPMPAHQLMPWMEKQKGPKAWRRP